MGARAERKTAKLHSVGGGSQGLTLPKSWLRKMGVADTVDLVFTGNTIMIEAPDESTDLEDRPEFARFLDFLAGDALAHPERLGNVVDLTAGDEELFAGVLTDDV